MDLDENVIESLLNELWKNTEILEHTLSSFNIKILNVAHSKYGGGGHIQTHIEFTTIDGNKIRKAKNSIGLAFKINFYNDSRLIYSSCANLYNDDINNFSGYDTINILGCFDNLIEHATSARIFVVAA